MKNKKGKEYHISWVEEGNDYITEKKIKNKKEAKELLDKVYNSGAKKIRVFEIEFGVETVDSSLSFEPYEIEISKVIKVYKVKSKK